MKRCENKQERRIEQTLKKIEIERVISRRDSVTIRYILYDDDPDRASRIITENIRRGRRDEGATQLTGSRSGKTHHGHLGTWVHSVATSREVSSVK